ncbi:MAG: hypothetical protein IKW98_04125 [Prevotella sp.]|nr:hypothetical protein [Prevotella sp.]
MATINVYEQYFLADCIFNGVERHAASVLLISDSECGTIRYEVAVNFFPHREEDDFAISYDAYLSKVVYEASGRRSKKREKELLDELRSIADELAAEANGSIDWEHPLIDARMG